MAKMLCECAVLGLLRRQNSVRMWGVGITVIPLPVSKCDLVLAAILLRNLRSYTCINVCSLDTVPAGPKAI